MTNKYKQPYEFSEQIEYEKYVKTNIKSPIEEILFKQAKKRGINLFWQKPIKYLNDKTNAPLHTDFYYEDSSGEIKIAIECDGKQHKTPDQQFNDRVRDMTLIAKGIEVIRFTGKEIFQNPKECIEKIERLIEKKSIERNIKANRSRIRLKIQKMFFIESFN